MMHSKSPWLALSRTPLRFRVFLQCCIQVLILTLLLLAFLSKAVAAGQAQAPPQTTPPDEVVHSVIDAIQKNYLRARANPLWNIARDKLLEGKFKNSSEVFQAVQKQLPLLEDTELNLLTPDEIAAVQSEALGQKIGLGLCDFCLDMQVETGRPRVITAIAGSPAMNAGIAPRDVIVAINGKPTSEMNHEQVMDALRSLAPEGVKLQIERDEKTLNVVLHPSSDKPQVVQSTVKSVSGKKVGYIRVALFTPDVTQKTKEAITKLEQSSVDGYVLDLRNNPGGFLAPANAIAGMFATGTLGYEVRSNNQKQPVETHGAPLTQRPLAVLINAGTASASEFLAGGLQGLHRGALIGERSYGRGQAQIFMELAQGYGIQIPAVQFLTPDGTGFKGKGIAPDVEVEQPQLPDAELTGPRDKQFLRAVQRLTTDQH
jgi:carboxyl-terminal processing protease